MEKYLSIGLMSGTSMDGIDAALIETDGEFQVRELGFLSAPYSLQTTVLLKSAELAMQHAQGDFLKAEKYFSQSVQDYLQNELRLTDDALFTSLEKILGSPVTLQATITHFTQLHAEIVKNLLQQHSLQPSQIDVIGFHGQTLLHKPNDQLTIQIGNGDQLAKFTRIKVVNNFRQNDVASGGQGAPLVPLYHFILATNFAKIPAAVVNCGGIANVSLFRTHKIEDIMGFDTGPGNNLVDRFIKQVTQGKMLMDKDGEMGKQGKVHDNILQALYEKSITNHYYEMPPPKSLDSSDLQLIPELNLLSHTDACRTLEAFTADSIVRSVKHFSTDFPTTWILCGGGWKNPVIREELISRLQQQHATAYDADDIGWNSQSLEAQAFAYFAVRTLKNLPITYPNITRVSAPTRGGVLHLP